MYELKLPGTPPSINTTGVGSNKNWYRFAREKDKWQGMVFICLLEAKVPKGLGRVHATAHLRFKSKRRRDEGNYRALLEKVVGDALQLGWIEDDTPEFFTFGELTFDEERGDPLTLVRLDVTEAR